MDVKQIYEERMTRLKKAINLEKPDRVPVFLFGSFFLKYGDPSAKMVDMVRRQEWCDQVTIQGYNKLKTIDAGQPVDMGRVDAVGSIFMSKSRIPGRDLPEDELWQVDESGYMMVEDYDAILNKGWKPFVDDYLINRLGYTREQITPDFAALQKRQTLFDSVGLVNLLGGITGGVPFDSLCAGRGMAKFYADLRRMPDKIEAVLNVMADEMAADTKNFLEAAKPFCVVCVPCVRANAGFVNRKTFERFGWPLFKRFTDVAINAGSKVLFHMDARWTEFLDFFTDFPKGTCIFDPDGMTDIFAIKRTLGDRMCITGDVSAAMLVVATPEEVYRYSRKLIEEIGPEGFILSSGCSVPPNAKPENVEALVAAAEA